MSRTRQSQSVPTLDFLDLPGLRTIRRCVHQKGLGPESRKRAGSRKKRTRQSLGCRVRRVLEVTAESVLPPAGCRTPGCRPVWRRGQSRERCYWDTPRDGMPVLLRVLVPRFRCETCSRSAAGAVRWAHGKHRVTRRLERHIFQRAIRDSFAAVVEDTGVSESVVRRIFCAFAEEAERLFPIEAPIALGIDEAHVAGRAALVLTDLEEGRIVDIKESRSGRSVRHALAAMENRERTEVVVIDHCAPYLRAVQDVLKGGPVVIDKRHVLELARTAMERIRIDVQKSLSTAARKHLKIDALLLNKRRHELRGRTEWLLLDGWLKNLPRLETAYWLKERFYDIYAAPSREVAETRFDAWASSIPPTHVKEFGPVVKTVKKWHDATFAYFNHRVTNGFAESANNLVKEVNRAGRGLSFAVLRWKLLHRYGVRTFDETMVRLAARHLLENPTPSGSKGGLTRSLQRRIARDLARQFGPLPGDPRRRPTRLSVAAGARRRGRAGPRGVSVR